MQSFSDDEYTPVSTEENQSSEAEWFRRQEQSYHDLRSQLERIERAATLSKFDKFYRYILSINDGIGHYAMLYGIALSLLLPFIPLVVVSCFAAYMGFKAAIRSVLHYDESDNKNRDKVAELRKRLTYLEQHEKERRKHTAQLILKIRKMWTECRQLQQELGMPLSMVSPSSVVQHVGLLQPIAEGQTEPRLELDHLTKVDRLNQLNLNDSPVERKMALVARQVNQNITQQPKRSMLRLFFMHPVWDSVFHFLGATGFYFGIPKMILGVAGITVVAGSTLGWGLLIGAAILAAGLSIEHYRLTQKLIHNKHALKAVQAEVDEISNRVNKHAQQEEVLLNELGTFENLKAELITQKLKSYDDDEHKSHQSSHGRFNRLFANASEMVYAFFTPAESQSVVKPSASLPRSPSATLSQG